MTAAIGNRVGHVLLQRIAAKLNCVLRTGYWHTGERCCPEFADENFLNHVKVYKFASQFSVNKRVLDVGCGTGYGTGLLAKCATHATGIDISRQALQYARAHYAFENVSFVRMNAEALAFADRSFDFIISTENFEHLHDQTANMREMARVLTDTGMLFLATPNREMFLETANQYHTHEFAYGELAELLREIFDEWVICENLLQPSTAIGVEMREHRSRRGELGIELLRTPVLWGKNVDASWLSNTHSFFCFARNPKRIAGDPRMG